MNSNPNASELIDLLAYRGDSPEQLVISKQGLEALFVEVKKRALKCFHESKIDRNISIFIEWLEKGNKQAIARKYEITRSAVYQICEKMMNICSELQMSDYL